jgi:hypothetical protein
MVVRSVSLAVLLATGRLPMFVASGPGDWEDAMKRFRYLRVLIGAPQLVIWNRTMACEITMPNREAFIALIDYWNKRSHDWVFVPQVSNER